MRRSGRVIDRVSPAMATSMNGRFTQRRAINTATYIRYRETLQPLISHANEQGPADCHFVTNKFLLADKPVHRERNLWRRIVSGDNGSTHFAERKSRICHSASELIEMWKAHGQLKLHARNIAISKEASLDGKGTRFAPESFHCINIIKVFDIEGKPYFLSYDPEANCGEAEVEKIHRIAPIPDEIPELTFDELERVQSVCPLFRIDNAEKLLRDADFSHPDSGVYAATMKHWLEEKPLS
jgi:hypothetical protein